MKKAICFTLVAGIMPTLVGSYHFINTIISYFNSYDNLNTITLAHVAFANLMVTGISIIVLTLFALKPGQRWCWYLLLFIIIWAGGNDTIALFIEWKINDGPYPYPLIPVIFGSLGLIFSYKPIFKAKVK